jgi:hypothetical protein
MIPLAIDSYSRIAEHLLSNLLFSKFETQSHSCALREEEQAEYNVARNGKLRDRSALANNDRRSGKSQTG